MTAAKTPRTQPSEVRRRDLLEAAATLFLQQGFDATPVDEIVLRAGMSKGLFYHYFSSKQEILAALREQFLQQFHDRVQGALEQAPEDDMAWMVFSEGFATRVSRATVSRRAS